jgi:hypothetical protein
MGVLKAFRKAAPPLRRLPSGTFTVDREGRVVISTLSSVFPAELVRDLGQHVVATFREAQQAELPLFELIIRCSSLRIIARELRGGAIVFLTPITPISATK